MVAYLEKLLDFVRVIRRRKVLVGGVTSTEYRYRGTRVTVLDDSDISPIKAKLRELGKK